MLQKSPLSLAPGQSRPLTFRINFSGIKLQRFCLSIHYTLMTSPGSVQGTTVVCSLTDKEITDPHKITFLHPSGIVSYAILRPPSAKACSQIPEGSALPILLNLHGAGLEADSWQVRKTLDAVPDLPAWALSPTGVTSWSGDDWRMTT